MAAAAPQFSDQRQFLVTIAGVDGYWVQVSGGGVSIPTTKAFDGGNPVPAVVTGNPVVDDLVLTRNFAPSASAAMMATMKATIASGTPFTSTITQIPTDAAYVPTGDPGDTWSGQLTKVTPIASDATKSGATAATVQLTFTCTKLT